MEDPELVVIWVNHLLTIQEMRLLVQEDRVVMVEQEIFQTLVLHKVCQEEHHHKMEILLVVEEVELLKQELRHQDLTVHL
tara:strand:- start:176 stop:415 length:240 start_codon:yes stop_codon:yes gene_type:complete